MKIAYLAAGAGGMYCGSCMRDNTLAAALNRLGHPTILVPTYTPLRTDDEDVSVRKVFYGGLGVFLAQKFSILRRPIPLLDRALSAPGLLRLLSKLSISTEAKSLGNLTVSILKGEDGNQRKALLELLDYLEWEVQPEVVHLTNSLFAGLAPALKKRLRVPIVCTLQGEDLFLEGLPESHRRQAIQLIARAADHIDAFVAVSGYTADFMAKYLGIGRERIRVVPPGLRLEGFPLDPKPACEPKPAGSAGRPFTIAYLARIAPEKGLSVLAEAYRLLREDLRATGAASGQPPPVLRAAGYMGRAERAYLSSVEQLLEKAGLARDFEYVGEVDRAEKIRFLREADVLSVPAPYPESMGLFAYEALACGTPVVFPESGAFPEIVAATGGGLVVPAGDAAALAQGLRRLLEDHALRADLGRRGAEAVRAGFNSEIMARRTLEVYGEVLSPRGQHAA